MQFKSAAALSHALMPVELKFVGDEQPGVFSGYASVFNTIDLGGDMIVKGAFRDTLKEWKKRGKNPPMIYSHGFGVADDIPIGVFDLLEEDDNGLKFEAHLIALDTDIMKRIYAAMKSNQLDGMSIGYRTKDAAFGTKPGEPRRTLKRVDLFEISVVLNPMNTESRAGQMKAARPTERKLERLLRDAADLSINEAKAFIAGGYKAAFPRDVDEQDEDVAGIVRLTQLLKGE